MRLFLFPLLVCLFQVGCAYQKVSLHEHHRIGVVSLIPNKVETKYVGMWAFSNKGSEADVPEAHLSQSTIAATESALRTSGFEVVGSGQENAEMSARYLHRQRSVGAYFADNLIGDRERASIGPELKQLVQKNRLDAVAVIVPHPPRDGTEATIGVGNYGFGTLAGKKDEVMAYAMTEILFFDGPSLHTLTFRIAEKLTPQPGIPFESEFRAYSPDQQQALLEAMRQAFRDRIGTAVSSVVKP